MNGVIYARYSSDNQREESIEGQIRECTAYAEKHGITIVEHYIDRAFSAKTDNRPEFQHMVADSGTKFVKDFFHTAQITVLESKRQCTKGRFTKALICSFAPPICLLGGRESIRLSYWSALSYWISDVYGYSHLQ